MLDGGCPRWTCSRNAILGHVIKNWDPGSDTRICHTGIKLHPRPAPTAGVRRPTPLLPTNAQHGANCRARLRTAYVRRDSSCGFWQKLLISASRHAVALLLPFRPIATVWQTSTYTHLRTLAATGLQRRNLKSGSMSSNNELVCGGPGRSIY